MTHWPIPAQEGGALMNTGGVKAVRRAGAVCARAACAGLKGRRMARVVLGV